VRKSQVRFSARVESGKGRHWGRGLGEPESRILRRFYIGLQGRKLPGGWRRKSRNRKAGKTYGNHTKGWGAAANLVRGQKAQAYDKE